MGSEFQRKQKLRRSKQKKYVNSKIQQRLKEKQDEEINAKQEALKEQAKSYLENWKNKSEWKFSKGKERNHKLTPKQHKSIL